MSLEENQPKSPKQIPKKGSQPIIKKQENLQNHIPKPQIPGTENQQNPANDESSTTMEEWPITAEEDLASPPPSPSGPYVQPWSPGPPGTSGMQETSDVQDQEQIEAIPEKVRNYPELTEGQNLKGGGGLRP